MLQTAYGHRIVSDWPLPARVAGPAERRLPVWRFRRMPVGVRPAVRIATPGLRVRIACIDGYLPQIADAHWTVADGWSVTVDPASVELRRIQTLLMGRLTGLLCHAVGTLTLHGSVVCCGSRGVLLTGPSGAGKSTIAYELYRLGWTWVADEIVLMRLAGNQVTAVPGWLGVRLEADLGEHPTEGGTKLLKPVHPIDAERAAHGPVPITEWYVLGGHDDPTGLRAVPIDGAERYRQVIAHAYWRRLHAYAIPVDRWLTISAAIAVAFGSASLLTRNRTRTTGVETARWIAER